MDSQKGALNSWKLPCDLISSMCLVSVLDVGSVRNRLVCRVSPPRMRSSLRRDPACGLFKAIAAAGLVIAMVAIVVVFAYCLGALWNERPTFRTARGVWRSGYEQSPSVLRIRISGAGVSSFARGSGKLLNSLFVTQQRLGRRPCLYCRASFREARPIWETFRHLRGPHLQSCLKLRAGWHDAIASAFYDADKLWRSSFRNLDLENSLNFPGTLGGSAAQRGRLPIACILACCSCRAQVDAFILIPHASVFTQFRIPPFQIPGNAAWPSANASKQPQ